MPSIDKDFLNKIQGDFKNYPCFIETGTSNGETTFALEPCFDKLYTIEFSEKYYNNTKNKYSGNKINFILGDSSIVFKSLLPTITDKCIFFLDGHYSSGDTGKSEKDCPLDEEITHINNLFQNDAIIIIDDFRLFGSDRSSGGCEDWSKINKENLLNILKSRIDRVYHLDSKLCKNDRLIIHINAKVNYNDSPYKEIPEELKSRYSLNNTIPILNWWLDGRTDLSEPVWTEQYLNSFIDRFTPYKINSNTHGPEDYGGASLMILNAVSKFNIMNKKVAVIGSISPWIEAILINFNNVVTTVEYNVPIIHSTKLNAVSYWDFKKADIKYDCIVTYSSVEHSGLGRHGDPLNPEGDLEAMVDIYNSLVDSGILIWGAPVGHDALVWNVHRIYGKIRLPLMFANFEELEWINNDKHKLLNQPLQNNSHNPVVILKKV